MEFLEGFEEDDAPQPPSYQVGSIGHLPGTSVTHPHAPDKNDKDSINPSRATLGRDEHHFTSPSHPFLSSTPLNGAQADDTSALPSVIFGDKLSAHSPSLLQSSAPSIPQNIVNSTRNANDTSNTSTSATPALHAVAPQSISSSGQTNAMQSGRTYARHPSTTMPAFGLDSSSSGSSSGSTSSSKAAGSASPSLFLPHQPGPVMLTSSSAGGPPYLQHQHSPLSTHAGRPFQSAAGNPTTLGNAGRIPIVQGATARYSNSFLEGSTSGGSAFGGVSPDARTGASNTNELGRVGISVRPTVLPPPSLTQSASPSSFTKPRDPASKTRGAVIDLTDLDDDADATSEKHSDGGSDSDEVQIKSEKIIVKPPPPLSIRHRQSTSSASSSNATSLNGSHSNLASYAPAGGPNQHQGASADDDDDEIQVTGESATVKPLCIGQLRGIALILYPIAELACPPEYESSSSPAPPPLPILISRAPPQTQGNIKNETIKLYSATTRENFAVMEHKLANVLGPMLTRDNRRGLGIWIEAHVIRNKSKSPMMLPLVMLLFCHPHLVHHVSAALERAAVYLGHPPSYDPAMHNGFAYSNPHGPLAQSSEAERRKREVLNGLSGVGSSSYAQGRFGSSSQTKTVEVKRDQVEKMFEQMKSGADLEEVEPDPMVTTKLYPHQKQALAFLLEREKLRSVEDVLKSTATNASRHANGSSNGKTLTDEDDEMISLWRPRRDMYGRHVGWHNVVTEVEIAADKPPPQCRGAILADDMGLGKTIVVISLVASSMLEAKLFSVKPPSKDRAIINSFDALAAHPMGKNNTIKQPGSLATANFSTPLYGMATTAIPGVSSASLFATNDNKKGKKESKTQKKREDAESTRLERLIIRSRATLIVCPLSTVVNWESQIEEHIGVAAVGSSSKRRIKGDKSGTSTPAGGLSVYIYHGNNRTSDLAELADYDIVITTYSTLGSEYSKQARKEEQDEEGTSSSDGGIEEVDAQGRAIKQKGKKRKRKKIEGDCTSPLQQIEWFRIVLDEAHMIKEHTTIQARAACDLMAERRVCLTGTPLQNSLNDLFSLMRFLRLEPFTDRAIWTAYIGAPAKVGDPLGVSRLQLLMRHLALRRTKSTKNKEGKPILSIPPKKDEIRYLTLDEQEKLFYSNHHQRYKHNFEMMEKSDSLLKNYCSILQEVLRLRQICAHMALVRDSEDAAASALGVDGGDVVSAIKAHGISKSRALRLLALMRDTGAAQCAECGMEMLSNGLEVAQDNVEEEKCQPKKKRPQTKKASAAASKVKAEDTDEGGNPSGSVSTSVVTRCQHLFCLYCFKEKMCTNYPDAVTASDKAICSICRDEISPVLDAVQVLASEVEALGFGESEGEAFPKSKAKVPDRVVEHSSKIRALLADLYPLSQNNPASANYAGGEADLECIDADPQYQPERDLPTKTVVFSQWTKLLDRIEDALNEAHIKFERLDGGMVRAERSKSLNTFKVDPSCEVLLVSLRAGGVGLNLTHASNVYLMEPSWNPSVENQAVDRIHRLGQTRPVRCVRLVVKDSIEANMLAIQKRKTELANLSLSQTLSKAQLAERRIDDLRTLFQ